MGTKKPRITITLTKRQHELLKAITEVSGHSMSSMVSELIEGSEPVLERMAVTFQKLKQASDAQKSHIAKTLEDAQTAFEPLVASGIDQLDMFFGQLVSFPGEDGSGGGCAAPPPEPSKKGTAPPLTNRGVTPLGEKVPKPLRGKAKQAISKTKVFEKVKGC